MGKHIADLFKLCQKKNKYIFIIYVHTYLHMKLHILICNKSVLADSSRARKNYSKYKNLIIWQLTAKKLYIHIYIHTYICPQAF